jgi:hypothetical protein
LITYSSPLKRRVLAPWRVAVRAQAPLSAAGTPEQTSCASAMHTMPRGFEILNCVRKTKTLGKCAKNALKIAAPLERTFPESSKLASSRARQILRNSRESPSHVVKRNFWPPGFERPDRVSRRSVQNSKGCAWAKSSCEPGTVVSSSVLIEMMQATSCSKGESNPCAASSKSAAFGKSATAARIR